MNKDFIRSKNRGFIRSPARDRNDRPIELFGTLMLSTRWVGLLQPDWNVYRTFRFTRIDTLIPELEPWIQEWTNDSEYTFYVEPGGGPRPPMMRLVSESGSNGAGVGPAGDANSRRLYYRYSIGRRDLVPVEESSTRIEWRANRGDHEYAPPRYRITLELSNPTPIAEVLSGFYEQFLEMDLPGEGLFYYPTFETVITDGGRRANSFRRPQVWAESGAVAEPAVGRFFHIEDIGYSREGAYIGDSEVINDENRKYLNSTGLWPVCGFYFAVPAVAMRFHKTGVFRNQIRRAFGGPERSGPDRGWQWDICEKPADVDVLTVNPGDVIARAVAGKVADIYGVVDGTDSSPLNRMGELVPFARPAPPCW